MGDIEEATNSHLRRKNDPRCDFAIHSMIDESSEQRGAPRKGASLF